MTQASPSFKHPILLSHWAGLFVATGLGLTNSLWFVLVFLVSPFVAIATFARIADRRVVEGLRPGWSIAYRIVTGALVLAAIAGVAASAGRLVRDDGHWFQNGPLAVLFLLTFVTAWPTAARPSPRRAAVPAMVVHIVWLPLVIADAASGPYYRPYVWSDVVISMSLIAILALSAVVAVLGIVGFRGESPIAPATARM